MYGSYSTIYGSAIRRRTSSLTDIRRPPRPVSETDDPSKIADHTPVYAVVNKSRKMKRVSSDENIRSSLDETAQLYSKVDKSKKRVGDGQPSGTDDVPTQCNVSVSTPQVSSSHITTVPCEINSGVSDGAYESIILSDPPKDDEYDTVAGDFGSESTDNVARKGRKDRLPSLATLKRVPEHIYDVIPETMRPLPSNDYDFIE